MFTKSVIQLNYKMKISISERINLPTVKCPVLLLVQHIFDQSWPKYLTVSFDYMMKETLSMY